MSSSCYCKICSWRVARRVRTALSGVLYNIIINYKTTRFGGTDVAVFTWSIVRARARDTFSAGHRLTHTPALHPHTHTPSACSTYEVMNTMRTRRATRTIREDDAAKIVYTYTAIVRRTSFWRPKHLRARAFRPKISHQKKIVFNKFRGAPALAVPENTEYTQRERV